MTIKNRVAENMPAKAALTKDEIIILDHVVTDNPQDAGKKKTLSTYIN